MVGKKVAWECAFSINLSNAYMKCFVPIRNSLMSSSDSFHNLETTILRFLFHETEFFYFFILIYCECK